jgi:aspartyl-tRNA(Asn)/glutamyl-tRNA(Gln) amidotransferase subunit A
LGTELDRNRYTRCASELTLRTLGSDLHSYFQNGQIVDATYLQGATVPLNVTGLPGVAMRFGTSTQGLPISVQIVGKWQAESTILHVASLLERVSPVRGEHPEI